MRKVTVVLAFLVSTVSVAAQAPQPITASLRTLWDGAKKNIVQSVDVMSEANFTFRPVETVRTYGQILGHLAGANYVICSAAKGEKTPHAEDAFEKLPTKAAIAKALNESIAYCDAVFAAADDRKLAEADRDALRHGQGRPLARARHEHRPSERALWQPGHLHADQRDCPAIIAVTCRHQSDLRPRTRRSRSWHGDHGVRDRKPF